MVSPAIGRLIWGRGCICDNWWLRSPGNNTNLAAFVNNNGNVEPGDNPINNVNNTLAIRPDFPCCQKRLCTRMPSVPWGKEPRSCPCPFGRGEHIPLEDTEAKLLLHPFRGLWPPAGGDLEGKPITDFEQVCNFDSLYRAHTKARLGKRHKPDVIAFEMDLAINLWAIKERLEKGTYAVGGYNRFMIHDPKDREIQALCYADRIVQHSLCDNVLTPFFETRLIYDNCACRVGKGTHFGMNRLAGFMRQHYKSHSTNGWILKADVRKFFGSIDHAVLLGRLRGVIPDPDVMRLLEHIVHSFNADTGRGLPMGNQTSQWFALFYLDPIDRLAKEKLRVPYYTRYMDDMVLLHPDKAFLQEALRQMRTLAEDELHIQFNEKTHIFPVAHGVDYLGWHFYLTDTGKVVKRLRTQNRKKLKRRMGALQAVYAAGRLEIEDINRSVAATNGHLCHGHTYKLRQHLYSTTKFVRQFEEEPI